MESTSFSGRDFLTLMDYTAEEIIAILDRAVDFRERLRRKEPHDMLRGRTAVALFEKPSTRTRVSFQVSCSHLGMHSYYMRPDEMQLSRGEPIKDTARVLDRYCDVLFIRTFGQEIVEEYARYMSKPVINALTNMTHPCQGLADLLTIRERKGAFKGLKLAYVGDVWNIAHTLMVCGAIFGMNVFVAHPRGYEPHERVLTFVNAKARETGATIRLTEDIEEAACEADIVYANVWHSMGGPEAWEGQRLHDFANYQVDSRVFGLARQDAIFMHCLPSHRGQEVTDDVLEHPRSVIFEQAENRLHLQKALLAEMLGGLGTPAAYR